jgi:hypothetical protein
MADNFDLKKFLKESKALENLNPSMKSINENGGNSTDYGSSPKEKEDGTYDISHIMKETSNKSLKAKIKDMIVAELDSAGDITIDNTPKGDPYANYFGESKDPEEKAEEDEALLDGGFGSFEEGYPEYDDEEDTYDYSNDYYDNEYGDSNDFGDTDEFDGYGGLDIDEAKKKEADVEDVEVTDTEIEDVPAEDEMPAEEAPAADGGIEDLAADMKGTEADLMDHLMKAFQIAKGMQNEKLETQVGNTLKFFVSEYIGGGEQ